MKINEEEPEKSTYFCSICRRYHEYDILPQQVSKLAREDGILLKSYSENEREISKHETKQTHQLLLMKMMKDYQNAQEESPTITYQEDPKLIVTNRVLRTIYLCVENGVSLINMKDIVHLQRVHGEILYHILKATDIVDNILLFTNRS